MKKRFIAMLAALPFACACGSSMPEPKQPLADAEAALRSAREVGADTQPAARLQAKLADEQIVDAKTLIKDGDYERATYLILRARADAELSVALAKERKALLEKDQSVEKSNTTLGTNAQGVTR